MLLICLSPALAFAPRADAFTQSCYDEYHRGRAPSLDVKLDLPSLTERLIEVGALDYRVTVVLCNAPKRAVSIMTLGIPSSGSEVAVPEGRYVFVRPIWFREINGDSYAGALWILGHELGHFARGHFDEDTALVREDIVKVERETQSDYYGGCLLAHVDPDHAMLMEASEVVRRLRSGIKDQTYPSREVAIQAVTNGFEECGGEAEPSPPVYDATDSISAFMIVEYESFQPHPVQLGQHSYIGYGHRISEDELKSQSIMIGNRDVILAQGLSKASALMLLLQDLNLARDAIKDCLGGNLEIDQHIALESFAYTIGNDAFRAGKVCRYLKSAEYHLVASAMEADFVSRSAEYQGSRHRRDEEISLWTSAMRLQPQVIAANSARAFGR